MASVIAGAALATLLAMPACANLEKRILYGIVRTESSGEPYAVHDDTDGRSYFPREWRRAAILVERLDAARHAFSVGLFQVENTNMARFHVSSVELLDPAPNVAIGCAIYREQLPALYAYNTGSRRESSAGDRYVAAVYGVPRSVAVPVAPVLTRPKVRVRLVPGNCRE